MSAKIIVAAKTCGHPNRLDTASCFEFNPDSDGLSLCIFDKYFLFEVMI